MEDNKMNCTLHGVQGFGLLCKHLAQSILDPTVLGFYEHDEGDTARPDAWCTACQARWDLAVTEAQREQWFSDCDFKLLCAVCWDKAKKLNK